MRRNQTRIRLQCRGMPALRVAALPPRTAAPGGTGGIPVRGAPWQTSPWISGEVDFVRKRRKPDAVVADSFARIAGSQPWNASASEQLRFQQGPYRRETAPVLFAGA